MWVGTDSTGPGPLQEERSGHTRAQKVDRVRIQGEDGHLRGQESLLGANRPSPRRGSWTSSLQGCESPHVHCLSLLARRILLELRGEELRGEELRGEDPTVNKTAECPLTRPLFTTRDSKNTTGVLDARLRTLPLGQPPTPS